MALKIDDITDGKPPLALPAVKIGFDLLQLLSSSMYIEPLTLYREYIQNAADSIDAALVAGVLSEAAVGLVELESDPLSRLIRIRDNGLGVSNENFVSTLQAIGASAKRGTSLRGFRGIGRLVGLGYCQELVFRSRSQGDTAVLEMTWDCKVLRNLLRESADIQLKDVIPTVTSVRSLNSEKWPEHFFEVELRNVVRHLDDQLLNVSAIERYVSQVAPVPFNIAFAQGSAITDHLQQAAQLHELNICLNGRKERIVKPYQSVATFSASRSVKISEIEYVSIPAIDEGVAAIGWIAHHEYLGSLPRESMMGGIRVREGNIQIGNCALLEEAFAEPRFNSWSIGELHILDRRLIPNGRRDNFEANVHYGNLVNHFAPIARDLGRRCRATSVSRNLERRFGLIEDELTRLLEQVGRRNQYEVIIANGTLRMGSLLEAMDALVGRAPTPVSSRSLSLRAVKARSAVDHFNERLARRVRRPTTSRMRGQLDILKLLYEVKSKAPLEGDLISKVLEELELQNTQLQLKATKPRA